MDFTVPSPERWWPNGLGEQRLYTVAAEVRRGRRADFETARLGLRTLEVVTQPDSVGESFFVRVNGVPNGAGGYANNVCDPSQGFRFTELAQENFMKIITKRGHRVIELAARFDF